MNHPSKSLGFDGLSEKTILYAEDDSIVRSVTIKAMTRNEMKVIEAQDGQEAINLFKEHQSNIDLILFDIMMPRKSGIEAAQEIFELAPDSKIVLCSGFYQSTDEEVAVVSKAKGFIQKPYTQQQLLKILSDVMTGQPSS